MCSLVYPLNYAISFGEMQVGGLLNIVMEFLFSGIYFPTINPSMAGPSGRAV